MVLVNLVQRLVDRLGDLTPLERGQHAGTLVADGVNRRFAIALVVVAIELAVIAWIRKRYMDTPVWSAAMQVGLGGALVFGAGILIGSS